MSRLRSLLHRTSERLEVMTGLAAVPATRWRPYKESWDRPDRIDGMSLEAQRIATLYHGQAAQIALSARVVYFAIPKAANSYVRRWLNSTEALAAFGSTCAIPPAGTYDPCFQFCHTLAQLPGGIRGRLSKPDFRFFTVVRHPYHRALSCFLDKRRDGAHSSVTRKLPRRAWESFPKFLEELSRGSNLYRDGHWAPQSWILAPVRSDLDRILAVTDLDAQLNALSIDWELPRSSAVPDSESHRMDASDLLNSYIDRETAQMLDELYRDDFLFFPGQGNCVHG